MKKIIVIAFMVLTVTLALSAAPVLATTGTENINVKFMDIDFNVNITNFRGGVYICKDANGNEVIPFIYEGTVFVPIRTVVRIFAKDTDWNSSTNTITIATPRYMKKWEEISVNEWPEDWAERKQPTKAIPVTYRDIKIIIDGIEFTPKDANGKTVEPFIYNGTTFVPIRAISEAFGVEVGWRHIGSEDGYEEYGHVDLKYEIAFTSHDLLRYVEQVYGNYISDNKKLAELFTEEPAFGTYVIDEGNGGLTKTAEASHLR
ncbi:MAG: copper amine oxidase N-terminal domain-containing protein, partial [Prevotella sp.]|nr:copper amine oxidase N-terminal domain-containing protein [Prevotella sp.]